MVMRPFRFIIHLVSRGCITVGRAYYHTPLHFFLYHSPNRLGCFGYIVERQIQNLLVGGVLISIRIKKNGILVTIL